MKSHVDAPAPPIPAKCQLAPPRRTFAVQLSSTPRGARLARLLAVQHLAEWGLPYDSDASHSSAVIITELAANAVRHCGNTGRDFRLRIVLGSAKTLRIEVTDARADRPLPPARRHPETGACDTAESGHGLLLVDALATCWGSSINDLITKTVWAELGTGL